MFLLFLVSTVVNKMLMKPVINTTVNLEKREGDFRFKHIMVSYVIGGPFAKELIQRVAERKETMCCLSFIVTFSHLLALLLWGL